MTDFKKDLYGQALMEFYEHQKPFDLILHNNYGTPEKMPIEVFFREDADLSDIEQLALDNCKGSVLDIGAGTGVHSLILQDMELEVTALDISEAAVEVMEMSGVNNTIKKDVLDFTEQKFDTLLLLMNGIGIVGQLGELNKYLVAFKNLLNEGGQILLDSSDISYLYEEPPENHYFGEIEYQYEHKEEKSEPFQWLYIDKETLAAEALKVGLSCQILQEDESDQYLAKLQIVD